MGARLLLTILLLWVPYAATGAEPLPTNGCLTVVFTGNGNGRLVSCHCPNAPWGGLAKTAHVLHSIRRAAGASNVLALDSGDRFPFVPDTMLANSLLQMLHTMPFDAMAIGDQELADGLEGWVAVQQQAGLWAQENDRSVLPWLSGSFRMTTGPNRGRSLTPVWRVFERAGLRIGVVSVTGANAVSHLGNRVADLQHVSPQETVRRFLAATTDTLDLRIVLSHQGVDADHELARAFPTIDLIVGGHSQSLLSPPEREGDTLICQAGKNGETIGMLLVWPRLGPRDQEAHPPVVAFDANDPFAPTLSESPRWRAVQCILPLDSTIDDDPMVSSLIQRYFAMVEKEAARRPIGRPPPAGASRGRLRLTNPALSVVLTNDEVRQLRVDMHNPGTEPVQIERIHSKAHCLGVVAAPDRVEPGATTNAVMEIHATRIDRLFRVEYSVLSDDPTAPVARGVVDGLLQGSLPWLQDVAARWTALAAGQPATASASAAASSPATEPPPALVTIDYFFTPDCEDCHELRETVLGPLTNRYAGLVALRALDITQPQHYRRFNELQPPATSTSDNALLVLVNGTDILAGRDAIANGLEAVVARHLASAPRTDGR